MNGYVPQDDDLGRFVGWMKKEFAGDWHIVCSGATRPFVMELLAKITPKACWSTNVCLKNGETPFCSVRLIKRGEK